MVHDLITMRKMNKEASKRRPATKIRGEKIPKEIMGNASAIRNFLNRPWTVEELSGGKTFRNKEII
jgi:hypothetical protein